MHPLYSGKAVQLSPQEDQSCICSASPSIGKHLQSLKQEDVCFSCMQVPYLILNKKQQENSVIFALEKGRGRGKWKGKEQEIGDQVGEEPGEVKEEGDREREKEKKWKNLRIKFSTCFSNITP